MSDISVVVGSMSQQKLAAVREACRRLGFSKIEVIGCQTVSGVNEQPVDMAETLTGAFNRVQQARAAEPKRLIWLGIESGIFRAPHLEVSIDLAVIAIMRPDGRCSFATSTGLGFPEVYVSKAEAQGFATTTVGSVIAQDMKCDSANPHAALTGGRLNRSDTLVHGIMAAFQLAF